MYSEYYGLREKPFSLLPDPDFLFPSQKHATALNLLELAIHNQSGFCTISGEIGTGKTTLIRELLNRLDSRVCVGLISNTYFTFAELLEWIVAAYGLEAGDHDAITLYQKFMDFVTQQYANGRHTLLIIDEAQNLSLSAMEELRMLCNVNSGKDLMLQIILVGQNELREKLRRPELAQFAQRVSLDYHLCALDEKETTEYIAHRLNKAGGSGDLFEDDAKRLIYKQTNGIPRLINRLCDLSLVYGLSENRKSIDARVIKAVSGDHQTENSMSVLGDSLVHVNRQSQTSQPVTTQAAEPSSPNADDNFKSLHSHQNTAQALKRAGEHSGARKMNESKQEKISVQHVTSADTVVNEAESPLKPSDESDQTTIIENSEALKTAAEKAAAERARAEVFAAEKAAQAKAAVEKAAAESAAAEKAEAERLAAEKLVAEMTVSDRIAADAAAQAKAAAEAATAERLEAEKLATEKDKASKLAEEKVSTEKQGAEKAIAEKLAVEKAASDEAEVAKAAAEKALAERIAAEKAANETAATADASVKKATEERIAVEKKMAGRVAELQAVSERLMTEQAAARRTASEKLKTEKMALAKVDEDDGLVHKAVSEKRSAAQDVKEKAAAAMQILERSNESRIAAEQAKAEQLVAEKAAVVKATEEKLALAKVAASHAAAAKQAAEQAAMVRAAAEKDALEKEAAAITAMQKAAEAANAAAEQVAVSEGGSKAEIVEHPAVREIHTDVLPKTGHLLGDEAPPQKPVTIIQHNRKRNLKWGIMTFAAGLLGSLWIISGYDKNNQDSNVVAQQQSVPEKAGNAEQGTLTEAAALEIGQDVKKPK